MQCSIVMEWLNFSSKSSRLGQEAEAIVELARGSDGGSWRVAAEAARAEAELARALEAVRKAASSAVAGL